MAVQETQSPFNSPPSGTSKALHPSVSVMEESRGSEGESVGFAVAGMLHLEYPAALTKGMLNRTQDSSLVIIWRLANSKGDFKRNALKSMAFKVKLNPKHF